jgi:hypothetical protein
VRTLVIHTGKTKSEITGPENMGEVTVELFIKAIREYNDDDWVQLFAILYNTEATGIAESPSGTRLEAKLYETVSFFLNGRKELEKLKVPKELEMRTVWSKDLPDSIRTIEIPNTIGRFSIGQAIQARKSLEGLTYLEEGLSKITAIYLQPLLDRSKFDMLRVIHWECIIDKMPITKIYPIGFFLLRKLNQPGNIFTRCWNLIRNWLHSRKEKP